MGFTELNYTSSPFSLDLVTPFFSALQTHVDRFYVRNRIFIIISKQLMISFIFCVSGKVYFFS